MQAFFSQRVSKCLRRPPGKACSRSISQRRRWNGSEGNLKRNVNWKKSVTRLFQGRFLPGCRIPGPQGILCVVRRPGYTLERVLRSGDPLLVVLEELQDPGNLGTIIRTGEAAGVTGVIMSAGTVDLFNPKTIRATMGSVFRVPFLYVDDLPQTVEQLRQGGISVYAAHLEGKTYYDDVSFLGPTAFLVGNEGNGLTEETASRADRYLKIPMEGRIESLNAAVAASLFMYETHRQRSSSRTGER